MPIFHLEMADKKSKNAEAENLIESLMDELQGDDSQSEESSINDKSLRIPEGLDALNPKRKDEIWKDVKESVGKKPFERGSANKSESVSENEDDSDKEEKGKSLFNIFKRDSSGDSTMQIPPTNDKTIAAGAYVRPSNENVLDDKVEIGGGFFGGKSGKPANRSFVSQDASLQQADNLKIAQKRILELEKEVDKLRSENEELASAADIIKSKLEEYTTKLENASKDKLNLKESLESEMLILRGSLQARENQLQKIKIKNEELESRVKSDFRKIRVRERELENRLELVRAEKVALINSKDEQILDLKRKIDHLQTELGNYRNKVLELNNILDQNQEQFKRTVRALRLALSNLEVTDENLVQIKKAE